MAGNAFSPLVTKAIFDAIAVSRRRKQRKRYALMNFDADEHREKSRQLYPWENVLRRARTQ